MLLLPEDTSATAEPEIVDVPPEPVISVAPVAVDWPLPLKLVIDVCELKNCAKANEAPLAPEKLFGTLPPLMVVPLIAVISVKTA
jgi:hypothetical protein